jgi:hypothetical protein
MTIVKDPETYFFTNPHPRLQPGDRVRFVKLPTDNIPEGTPAVVGAYWCTSPVHGDLYHVEIDDHVVTTPFKYLRLESGERADQGCGEGQPVLVPKESK